MTVLKTYKKNMRAGVKCFLLLIINKKLRQSNLIKPLIALIVVTLVTTSIFLAVYNSAQNPPYYAAPGSNTETWGAPDGTYLQRDWGWYDNQTMIWSFTMCENEGPLHGGWLIQNATIVPVLGQEGVYPIDARLYITLKDNVIVKAEVHSLFEYGN
jgi:hypothetical protein